MKNIPKNQYSNNQFKQEQISTTEDSKRPDVDFLRRNMERVRIAGLRNK